MDWALGASSSMQLTSPELAREKLFSLCHFLCRFEIVVIANFLIIITSHGFLLIGLA
jgi:hypothetical protein